MVTPKMNTDERAPVMTALTPERIAEIRERWDRSRVATTLERPRHVFDDFDALLAELDRLTKWADGFSDRQLEERRTGEEYQRELRTRAEAAEREIAEALQLDGACSTLSELVAGCFEARVEMDRYRVVVEATQKYKARVDEVEEVRLALEESGGAAGPPMESVYERLYDAEHKMFKALAALGNRDSP